MDSLIDQLRNADMEGFKIKLILLFILIFEYDILNELVQRPPRFFGQPDAPAVINN